MSLLDNFGQSLSKGFGKFLETYDKIAKPIGQTISTGFLLGDRENPELQDGFQLDDVKRTYERAKTISPGQAMLVSEISPFKGITEVAKVGIKAFGKEAPKFLQEDFNIYEEQQRKQAFEEEIVGKIASGTIDAVVTWFADPLVVGGKAIKIARMGTKGGKIPGIIETRAPVTAEQISNAVNKGGWDEFIRFASRQDVDKATLLKNKTVQKSSNPELLASVLGDVGDVEVGRTVLKAVLGDAESLTRLTGEHANIQASILRAGKKIDKFRPGKDVNGVLAGTAEMRILKNEYEALKLKDQAFARAIELSEQSVYATGGTAASRFAFTEARRARKGAAKMERTLGRGVWSSKDFQYSAFSPVMRVLTWGGRQRPSGWVTGRGINAAGSADEVIAYMDAVKAWSGPESAKLKRKYLNQFLDADDMSRPLIVEKIEKESINAVARSFGYDRKLPVDDAVEFAQKLNVSPDKIDTMADVLYYETVNRRSTPLRNLKENGFFIDEADRKVTVPFISSQLAEATPMIDIRMFQKIAKEHKRGLEGTFATVKDGIESAYLIFDSIWRPSVLLRLGYPQRNVGEGSLRAMAYMNGFMEYMKPYQGLDSFTRNRLASAKDRIAKRKVSDSIIFGGNKTKISMFKTWRELSDVQNLEINFLRTERTNLLDNIKKIQKELKSTKVNTRKVELQTEIAQLRNRITLVDEDLIKASKVLEDIGTFSSRKGIKGNRHRTGQKAYIHKNIRIKGAYEDETGSYAMRQSSAERRTSLELTNPMSIYEDTSRKVSKGFGTVEPYNVKNPNVLNKNYVDAIQELSELYRNDLVTKTILAADDSYAAVDDIVRLARTDKKLQRDLKMSGVALNSTDIRAHATQLADAIDQFFPDKILRKELSQGRVSPERIRNLIGDRTDLVPLSGTIIESASSKTLYQNYRAFINKAFKYIGALPEDTLVRHPFYNAVYKRAVNDQVDRALIAGKEITNESLERMIQNGHRFAMRETNETLYTIQRYSNAAAAFAFFAPFIQAQFNTLRVWGKLTYENPQVIGRAMQIWNAPEKAGFEEVDPIDGETYVTFQGAAIMPEWLEKATGGNTVLRFPKRGANIVLAGDPWWNPGAGPLVQVAASEVLKNSPDIDQQLTEKFGIPIPSKRFLDFIVQERPSGETLSWDLLLPASARRVVSMTRGTAATDYANTITSLLAVNTQRYKDGKRDTMPTYDEMEAQATAMFALRLFTNLTLPVIPQFRSEYEPYINQWRIEQQKGAINGVTPEERFYEMYPEYFTLAYSNTRNVAGVYSTENAVFLAKKNRNLVSEVAQFDPSLIQLITNDGVERDFDRASYLWQANTSPIPGDKGTYRERLSPEEAVKAQDVRKGWIEYNRFNDALDAELEKNNIKSLNSSAGQPYRDLKQRFVDDLLANNRSFAEEYGIYEIGGWKNTIRAINSILEDENYMQENDNETWALMRDYMDSREDIVEMLEERKAAGGSGVITATSNADLLEAWENYISDIKSENTLFSSWYNRFLERDPLERLK